MTKTELKERNKNIATVVFCLTFLASCIFFYRHFYNVEEWEVRKYNETKEYIYDDDCHTSDLIDMNIYKVLGQTAGSSLGTAAVACGGYVLYTNAIDKKKALK